MRFVILLKTLSFLILSTAIYYYFLLLFEIEILYLDIYFDALEFHRGK